MEAGIVVVHVELAEMTEVSRAGVALLPYLLCILQSCSHAARIHVHMSEVILGEEGGQRRGAVISLSWENSAPKCSRTSI